MLRFSFFVVVIVLLSSFSIHARSISLDHSTGTWENFGQKIIPGCEVSFYLRIENTEGPRSSGIVNGFRIYGSSSFDPIVIEVVHPEFESYFDLVFYTNYFSADGFGADTVGIGGSNISGGGLLAGFNEVVYKITTGGVAPGETLCLDSTYYPPTGTWSWAPGGTPSWDGPHCFTSEEPPCIESSMSNCPDTISFSIDNPISYTFEASNDGCLSMTYYLIDGPGSINAGSGEWTYTPLPADAGTIQNITVAVSNFCFGRRSECSTFIRFINCDPTIDINGDCGSDIADLVYLVEFMFNEGPIPPVFELADVNADAELNIADLVYIVEYMFNNGPPPIG